jgi:predicted ATPase
LDTVEATGERWWEAEIHRLRGKINVRRGVRAADSEKSFRRAMDVAAGQGAKLLELRAAMSLARLWGEQGERRKAHDLLHPVYDWFTEGFDTADLKDAKALLAELAS